MTFSTILHVHRDEGHPSDQRAVVPPSAGRCGLAVRAGEHPRVRSRGYARGRAQSWRRHDVIKAQADTCSIRLYVSGVLRGYKHRL